jgi:carbamoylphosphate synthase large subunit
LVAGNGHTHVWGTSPNSIDIAEDRDRWMELLTKLNIRQPAGKNLLGFRLQTPSCSVE